MDVKTKSLASLLVTLSMTAHATSFNGTWEHHGKAESGIWLKTQQQGKDVRFQMEISRGGPSYNTGWIEGTIELKNGKGVFRSSEFGQCEIAFEFKEKSVRVSHPDMHIQCGFGYNVFAEGTLIRKSHARPKFCAEDPRTGECNDN